MVIGAGPVGAHTAAAIAGHDHSVALLDRYPRSKTPERCGCLVTPRVLDLVDASRTVVNRIRGAIVHSPGGRKVVIDGGKTKAVVLDRKMFDQRMVSQAEDAGAEGVFGTTAKSARHVGEGIEVTVEKKNVQRRITCRLLIGADGAMSKVGRWFSVPVTGTALPGCEQTMSGAAGDGDFVKLFVGRDFAPGFFGWIIPSGDTSRVGLCAESGNVRTSLRRMVSMPMVREYIGESRPLRYHAGQIPIGFPRRTYADNLMLVGDAACQVKATSGGGLFTGLLSGKLCAETAVEALEEGDHSSERLSAYQKAWTRRIGKELRRDLAIHKSYASLSDRQLEEISGLLDKPAILDIVRRYGDIDFPSKVGWVLVREEPRLIKYAGKALRAMLPKIN